MLKLNSNTSFGDFPIKISREDYQGSNAPQHLVGLGYDSSILTALTSAGRIGSRTFSFFWGLSGATTAAQMPGSLVFGGYDKAKTIGPNITLPLVRSSKCGTGLVVSVSQILLNFPNASTTDILSSTSISACLTPSFPVMASLRYQSGPMENYARDTATNWLGRDNNIQSPIRSYGVNFFGVLYDPSKV
jgi:hypothetical protein